MSFAASARGREHLLVSSKVFETTKAVMEAPTETKNWEVR